MAQMSNSLLIKIDEKSSIPINVQIAEQIKLLIATRNLKPGDPLPTVTQLAQFLELNHNTIASVYTDLIKADYLVAQRGKGTFVAQSEAIKLLLRTQHLYRLIDPAYLAAEQMGFDPSSFGIMSYARAVSLKHTPSNLPKCVFVECNEHDTLAFLEAIKLEISHPLLLIELEDLQAEKPEAMSKIQAANLIITTSFHIEEISQYTRPSQEVVCVRLTLDWSPLTNLAALSNKARALMVCRGIVGSMSMKQIVERTGISHLNLKYMSLEQFQNNLHLLKEFEVVYVSSLVYDLVYKLSAQSEKIKKFEFRLSSESAALVKTRLAAIQQVLSGSSLQNSLPKDGKDLTPA